MKNFDTNSTGEFGETLIVKKDLVGDTYCTCSGSDIDPEAITDDEYVDGAHYQRTIGYFCNNCNKEIDPQEYPIFNSEEDGFNTK